MTCFVILVESQRLSDDSIIENLPPAIMVADTLSHTPSFLVATQFKPPLSINVSSSASLRSYEVIPWLKYAPFSIILIACSCATYHKEDKLNNNNAFEENFVPEPLYEPDNVFWRNSRQIIRINVLNRGPYEQARVFANWFEVTREINQTMVPPQCGCIKGVIYGIITNNFTTIRITLNRLKHFDSRINSTNNSHVDIGIMAVTLLPPQTIVSVHDSFYNSKFDCQTNNHNISANEAKLWYITWGVTNNIVVTDQSDAETISTTRIRRRSPRDVQMTPLIKPIIPFDNDTLIPSNSVHDNNNDVDNEILFSNNWETPMYFSPLFDVRSEDGEMSLFHLSRIGTQFYTLHSVIFCLRIKLLKNIYNSVDISTGNQIKNVFLKIWVNWKNGDPQLSLISIDSAQIYPSHLNLTNDKKLIRESSNTAGLYPILIGFLILVCLSFFINRNYIYKCFQIVKKKIQKIK